MGTATVTSILNGMHEGADLTNSVVHLARAQSARNTQLLMQLYALKESIDMQEAASLALIQSAMGIGQNVDKLA